MILLLAHRRKFVLALAVFVVVVLCTAQHYETQVEQAPLPCAAGEDVYTCVDRTLPGHYLLP